ncbi:hypothetical protein [Streptomyces sp. NPDC004270]
MISVPASPTTPVALPKLKLSVAAVPPQSAYAHSPFTGDMGDIPRE